VPTRYKVALRRPALRDTGAYNYRKDYKHQSCSRIYEEGGREGGDREHHCVGCRRASLFLRFQADLGLLLAALGAQHPDHFFGSQRHHPDHFSASPPRLFGGTCVGGGDALLYSRPSKANFFLIAGGLYAVTTLREAGGQGDGVI
jgi:hypothetical protein